MLLDILRDEIVRIAAPSRIVLFSQKTHPDGRLPSSCAW